jgi:hypothetical protein
MVINVWDIKDKNMKPHLKLCSVLSRKKTLIQDVLIDIPLLHD